MSTRIVMRKKERLCSRTRNTPIVVSASPLDAHRDRHKARTSRLGECAVVTRLDVRVDERSWNQQASAAIEPKPRLRTRMNRWLESRRRKSRTLSTATYRAAKDVS